MESAAYNRGGTDAFQDRIGILQRVKAWNYRKLVNKVRDKRLSDLCIIGV